MDKVRNDSPTPAKKEGKHLSQARERALKGMGYFVRSAGETPASTWAQGAGIALFCKQSGDNPKDLAVALLRDPSLVAKIFEIGEKKHKLVERPMRKIVPGEASAFISRDFGIADALMVFDIEDIVAIRGAYDPKIENIQKRNFVVQNFVEELSKQKLGKKLEVEGDSLTY